MSLILEALKKSESQRRLGEAPDIGTPVTTRRRRHNLAPWLLAAIVLAVLGGAWWLRGPATAPVDSAVPASPPTGTTAATNPRVATADTIVAKPTPTPAFRTQQRSVNNAAPMPAATQPDAAARTSATPPVVQGMTSVVSPAVAEKLAPGGLIAAPANPNSAKSRATDTPKPYGRGHAATASNASAPVKSGVAQSTKTTQKTAAGTETPTLPTLDEMPIDVRKDLPESLISMQVYSSDPARRFVVVSGERKVEGDTVNGTYTIREIRANGVVFESHGQRFLVPRPGS